MANDPRVIYDCSIVRCVFEGVDCAKELGGIKVAYYYTTKKYSVALCGSGGELIDRFDFSPTEHTAVFGEATLGTCTVATVKPRGHTLIGISRADVQSGNYVLEVYKIAPQVFFPRCINLDTTPKESILDLHAVRI